MLRPRLTESVDFAVETDVLGVAYWDETGFHFKMSTCVVCGWPRSDHHVIDNHGNILDEGKGGCLQYEPPLTERLQDSAGINDKRNYQGGTE